LSSWVPCWLNNDWRNSYYEESLKSLRDSRGKRSPYKKPSAGHLDLPEHIIPLSVASDKMYIWSFSFCHESTIIPPHSSPLCDDKFYILLIKTQPLYQVIPSLRPPSHLIPQRSTPPPILSLFSLPAPLHSIIGTSRLVCQPPRPLRTFRRFIPKPHFV
jgi:hypothetical protein